VNYASWIQRVGGYLIDGLIAGVPGGIGSIISNTSSADGTMSVSAALIGAVFGFVSLGLTIYNRWILGGRTGQTWGRRALNIRMVSEQTGQPIGAWLAFVRDLCHVLDSLACYIGWLFPLWDAKRQTFADKIMKTVVVAA
jgi:uncharacterized RDD family membrane protein YckC